MKIIAISSGDGYRSEIPLIIQMFNEGLDVLHVRKPNFSEQLMDEYINAIPVGFHNRIVLHSFHELALKFNLKGIHITKRYKKQKIKTWFNILYLKFKKPNLTISSSCHSLSNLKSYSKRYDYVFLSPVFDSISKKNKHAGFSFTQIKNKLQSCKENNIYALGGVAINNISKAKEIGFDGVVLLGVLWKDNNGSLNTFVKIKKKIEHSSSVQEEAVVAS